MTVLEHEASEVSSSIMSFSDVLLTCSHPPNSTPQGHKPTLLHQLPPDARRQAYGTTPRLRHCLNDRTLLLLANSALPQLRLHTALVYVILPTHRRR